MFILLIFYILISYYKNYIYYCYNIIIYSHIYRLLNFELWCLLGLYVCCIPNKAKGVAA